MMKIEDHDFRPLNEFPLKWRWTDSHWHELPDEALETIQPFTEDKSHELLQYSLTFSNALGLFESPFENISRTPAPANSSEVRQWLLDRSDNKIETVIVSWDEHNAVLVRWDVFCEYWDDFCYPVSDCVTIWPPSEQWAVMYLHHEEFVFGVRCG